MQAEQNGQFRTQRGYELSNISENGLTSAMEDYLEMIARLCIQVGYARVGKLSERLLVKPSSASKMVKKLRLLGMLDLEETDKIVLTPMGKTCAQWLLYRHETLDRFLHFLGCDDPLKETELLEHWVSPQTISRIGSLLSFFESDPQRQALYQKHLEDCAKI